MVASRLLALLMFAVASVEAAITHVNDGTPANSSNGSSLTVTIPSTTSGNILIGTFSRGSSTALPTSVTGSCSGSWGVLTSHATTHGIVIYCCTSASSGGTSVVVTWAAKGNIQAQVSEFSGATCTTDGTNGNSGTSANPSTGSISTANAADLLIGMERTLSATFSSGPTNSFIDMLTFTATRAAYRIVSSTGTYSTDWTYTGSAAWDGAIAAVQAAGGGGTVVKDVIMRGRIAAPR